MPRDWFQPFHQSSSVVTLSAVGMFEYRTYLAISRAIFTQIHTEFGKKKGSRLIAEYFLIKKFSQQNKTATNEHVFTYEPS